MAFRHDLVYSNHKKKPQALTCNRKPTLEGTQACFEMYGDMRILLNSWIKQFKKINFID